MSSENTVNENSVVAETSDGRMENCTFCNIIADNDSRVILEPRSDQFVVIKDIRPVATHHFLVLSHKHIPSANYLKLCEQDRNLLTNMISAAKQILLNNGCDLNDTRMGFHWPPFYTIGHLHLHAISPLSSMSVIHRYIAFNPRFSFIFVDASWVQNRIGCKENDTENQSTVLRNNL